MNILKEVLKNEVYPALGCTEPVAAAYACAEASRLAGLKKFSSFDLTVTMDPGTYKNGFAVNLPNTNGEKGNLIACALGLIIARPDLKHSIFAGANAKTLALARKLASGGKIKLCIDYTKKDFFVEAALKTGKNEAVCSLSKGHFNISFLSLNGKILRSASSKEKTLAYREFLKNASFKDLLSWAEKADSRDLSYIKKGVELNLSVSEKGMATNNTALALKKAANKGLLADDPCTEAKIKASAATDARMNGLPLAVMSSGQSGNQGVVAAILPYIYGKRMGKEEKKILKSVALAHLVNAYIKTFLGELSPICGCAVSSGAGAACAIAFQETDDAGKIESAGRNVIADLGGMFCDGAKAGCALKVASSCDCAFRSAALALNGWAVSEKDGFCEKTFSKTVKNLARLSAIGMSAVDSLIIETMAKKS